MQFHDRQRIVSMFFNFRNEVQERGGTSEKSKVFQSGAKFVRLHRGALAAATSRHREVTGLPVASRWDCFGVSAAEEVASQRCSPFCSFTASRSGRLVDKLGVKL